MAHGGGGGGGGGGGADCRKMSSLFVGGRPQLNHLFPPDRMDGVLRGGGGEVRESPRLTPSTTLFLLEI